MNKTKKSKKYITIIKYPYNEYLQTIITIIFVILRLKETVIAWQSYEVISLFSFLSPLTPTGCRSVAEEHSP